MRAELYNGVPLLEGTCGSCGNPGGSLVIDDHNISEHLCPACAQAMALHDAAYDQLERQMLEVIRAWAKLWARIPGMPNASEMLGRMSRNADAAVAGSE